MDGTCGRNDSVVLVPVAAMRGNLYKSLSGCIAVETRCCRIYKEFSRLFPETREFWEKLAAEEENHISILIVGRGFHRDKKLTDFEPPSLSGISETLVLTDAINKRIKNERITLKEALAIALALEESVAEGYLPNAIKQERDPALLSVFRKLFVETQSHSARIRDLMENKGF